jgi:hypothetical protein
MQPDPCANSPSPPRAALPFHKFLGKLLRLKKMKESKALWINLRAGAAGLDGPFLQEFNYPYAFLHMLERPAEDRPQMIMLVGDSYKRTSSKNIFGKHFKILSNDIKHEVHLRVLHEKPTTLVADCELHLLPRMETVLGGPLPGHLRRSLVKGFSQALDPIVLATRVYAQLLAPLSTLICIFADDFGGMNAVAEFLAGWLVGLAEPPDIPGARPRMVILRQWDEALRGEFNESMASRKFLGRLANHTNGRARNLKDGLTKEAFEVLLAKRFASLKVRALPPIGMAASPAWDSVCTRIFWDSERVQKLRLRERSAFSALHFETLFHAACEHFAEDVDRPFSFVRASRLQNPVSPDLSFHLHTFLRLAIPESIDFSVSIVSSALNLDSYPPGAHRRYYQPFRK